MDNGIKITLKLSNNNNSGERTQSKKSMKQQKIAFFKFKSRDHFYDQLCQQMQKCARKIKSQGGKIQAAPSQKIQAAPAPNQQSANKVSDFSESIAKMNDSPVIQDADSEQDLVEGVR